MSNGKNPRTRLKCLMARFGLTRRAARSVTHGTDRQLRLVQRHQRHGGLR